jgi:alpha-L-rhamnosidase
MKYIRINWRMFLLSFLLFAACTVETVEAKSKVTSLRCRGIVNPEGIDEAAFSWKIESDEYNVTQAAYEIEIAASRKDLLNGHNLWKSGTVKSDRQFNVRPEGMNTEHGLLYWWRVRIRDGKGQASAWSEPASFSIGLNAPSDWKARWITAEWSKGSPMPYFRKEFTPERRTAKIQRAVAYFSGLGYGDLYLNGELIDKTRMLNPAQTNYEQYALYSAFDVTPELKESGNCLGVMLGEGFYGQNVAWGGWAKYGDPIFILQMEIVYEDGYRQLVVSDESWQWHPGPVLKNNIYAGEIYDATQEISGWAENGAQLNGWKNTVLANGVVPQELHPQIMEPIRMKDKIDAVKVWKAANGNWIYDFGVNVAGVPQITVNQPKGTRLVMKMGEILNDDGTVNYQTTGGFATGVVQTDEYICSGNGQETWSPRFIYHGYRYLELSGAVSEPGQDAVKTFIVHTDVAKRGDFECSDPQINKLHELAVRTALSNLHGIPTDCPQREKCGWLGDAHTVAPFENLNFDMNNFWAKYMEDIHSTSSAFEKYTLHHRYSNAIFYWADKAAGIPYMIAPGKRLCGVASPDWGTAVVQLPWYSYLYYGNDELLKKYYPDMKRWVDYVETLTVQDSLKIKHIVPFGLGDWCPPLGNKTIDCPIQLSSTVFHYLDASILAKTAVLLGKDEDVNRYNELKGKIAAAFVEAFYDKANKTFGSQTANSLALNYGLVPAGDEEAVSNAIVRNMNERYNGFIHTGIFGTGRIGQALSRFGNKQAAWKLFTKKGENSFAYMWDNAGATSLWEILPINAASRDSCLIKGEYSLNHPMLGAYDTWFYEDLAGISTTETGAGFKEISFSLPMSDYLDWVKSSIETPYGKAVSEWSHEGGKLVWTITIPPNTSGIVNLQSGKKILVNGKAFNGKPLKENSFKFGSGKYRIEII